MWERAATEIAEAMGSTMMDVINNNGKNVPLGRYGTAEEVAAVIAFLCSNAASYVNGISMEVDGGQANYL
jgi:3-oxoacyl-[acyl-carrier protein] reductase